MSKKSKKLYIPSRMKIQVGITVQNQEALLPISDMADGCIGCMLVFRTKTAALKWGGDADLIVIPEPKMVEEKD